MMLLSGEKAYRIVEPNFVRRTMVKFISFKFAYTDPRKTILSNCLGQGWHDLKTKPEFVLNRVLESFVRRYDPIKLESQ